MNMFVNVNIHIYIHICIYTHEHAHIYSCSYIQLGFKEVGRCWTLLEHMLVLEQIRSCSSRICSSTCSSSVCLSTCSSRLFSRVESASRDTETPEFLGPREWSCWTLLEHVLVLKLNLLEHVLEQILLEHVLERILLGHEHVQTLLSCRICIMGYRDP